MDRDLHTFLAQLGRTLTPDLFQKTAARFAAEALRPTPDICSVIRDVAYGPHDRHRLDLFVPAAQGRDRAVLVFVHGGGFVRGDKGGPDDPYYNNIGAWAARQGYVAATITYRLAPSAVWPAGPEDIAAALGWIAKNVAGHGGSANKIVLMGQSAGAVHVSGYLAGHHGRKKTTPLAGAVMLSGIYDLTTLVHSDYERAYFGADVVRFGEQSALQDLLKADVPAFYSVGEFDPDTFQWQAAQLVAEYLEAHDRWPRMHFLSGQNHVSALYQLGLPSDPLGPELADFIDFVTGP